jgi:general L-amino acid transport system permease protein
VAVVLLAAYLYNNLLTNLRNQGIRTSFAYLDGPAGFQIPFSDFRSSQPVRAAVRTGVLNTLSVAILGVVLATIVGTVVGVARLSTNWLVRRLAGVYVESLRNLPPLVVIVFMFTAVFLRLPRIDEAREVLGVLVISNRTIGMTALRAGDGFGTYLAVLAVGAAGAAVLWRWRTRRSDRTGEPARRVLWAVGFLVVVGVVGHLVLGGPVVIERPEVVGRQVRGGFNMSANYAALLAALVIYTASYIAEIVRGSIQAVPVGQTEAADALALTAFQRLRFITLPQAFRIAIPPTANQYLNLAKNSSLGLAIGFPEVTTVTWIAIGNGNPAPQSIVVLMGLYLSLSLTIAAVTNLINRRFQLVER